ncbi:hypothetical protein NEHOM01_1236 [Nematocida homosporus]|uniref:uncharacterized protein n=1 Tax=Nematocida homosporus TaxID=1912981 RepID=UPI00221FA7C7|nr:uncharacterized protein NEHOM01_1236 [Nematocida homosporus]KAI5186033.1 hypothetical protein NEHOM01_1236 [Nematocida homosporus]
MLRTLLIIGRNFRPITPFMSVYLVEEKGFTTKDIVDRIIPWWLYSMLIFSLIVPVLVNQLGLLGSISLSVLGELLGTGLLIGMKKRSLIITVVVEILSALRSSMIVADKRFYGESNQDRANRYSTIRKIAGMFSSFVAQNTYCISGGCLPALYLTIMAQGLVLGLTLLLPKEADSVVATPVSLSGISPGLLAKVFSYTGAFTLSSCFKIYIDVVLIERTGQVGRCDRMIKVMLDKVSYVFYMVSLGLVKLIGMVDKKVKVLGVVNRDKALHGYMEGMTKIAAAVLAMPLVRWTGKNYAYTEGLCVISWIMQVVGIVALRHSNSLMHGYVSYLLSFWGSSMTIYISYNRINEMAKEHVITIISYVSGVSCAVHAIIDLVARKKNLRAERRFMLYAKLGTGLFGCAAICSMIEYVQR